MSSRELTDYWKSMGFAMSNADIALPKLFQGYRKGACITELKVLTPTGQTTAGINLFDPA